MHSADSYPFEVCRQKVLHDTVEIAYVAKGRADKPCLLMIHGLGHALIAWSHNIPELSKNFYVVAIDLPGNGLSSKSMSYQYGMHFFAEAIADFIVQMKLKEIVLCGHSMGGQIALTLALRQMPQVKGLLLLAPAGLEQFSPLERKLYESTMYLVDMVSSEENSLRKATFNSFYLMPPNATKFLNDLLELMHMQTKAHYRYMIESCIMGMLEEPVYDRLAEITVPVHIIFGEKDLLIPNKIIHRINIKQLLEEAVPQFQNASYTLIPRCGHFLQWEQADEVNYYIADFAKGIFGYQNFPA
ncbi:MAG TPA: alpha/beta hydrolase [Edaphocola sp.]|nr:alpha/beta hydrolase [Edaphocola sp.]